MTATPSELQDLFNRTPRRHNDENVKEINSIVAEYEDILLEIEAINPFYEKQISSFFESVEEVKSGIKKSLDKKISKKSKDSFFDEASGTLKENIESLIAMYGDGNRVA
jgi:CRISPR/Cas system CSM-associated protein Csm2 small subunit